MKQLIYSVELPGYIRQIKLSEARQAKYYKPGDKIPKKYADKERFKFQKWPTTGKTNLVDTLEGKRVISNPRSAGTPKWLQINNQYIYSGVMHPQTRNKMIEKIKQSYGEYKAVRHLPPITTFPVIIEAELHDLIHDPDIRHQLWDLDNRFTPYGKTFMDYMQEIGVLPEDHCLYVTGPPSVLFYPIKEDEERKLVFHFYHDQREGLKDFDVDIWKDTQ